MTLHATREGDKVKVHITSGPVTASVEEHAAHLTYFHAQLGTLLADVQGYGAARAQAGYERYREHAGGVSKFSGHALPSWDDQDEETQGHWVAAFTE
jgi:hypothetical protein